MRWRDKCVFKTNEPASDMDLNCAHCSYCPEDVNEGGALSICVYMPEYYKSTWYGSHK